MPFTGSHPAAVVPLLVSGRFRGWLAPTALVIGSMSPDLPYYLPPPAHEVPVAWTHSGAGVVGLDLVTGLLCVALWHGLLDPGGVPRRQARAAWCAVALASALGAVAGAVHAADDGPRRVLFAIATWGGGVAAAVAVLAAVALTVARPSREQAPT
ncbi:DUF4184 family protein [Spongisporangium articulatum]|uniref:DUF4184 family protein n=1 Tax=Spongisporangium articulatum TaxID=3362603 RepID=A0ABW8APZ0_9ACTN